MAFVSEVRLVVDYIKSLEDGFKKAITKALVATGQRAEFLAKRNSTEQFTGRNDRRLSGALLNSIYAGYEDTRPYPTLYLGVKNIPYGAIHEFGGTIRPVRAKHLWIPQYRNAGKMTPREFFNIKNQNPSWFFLNDKVAGKWVNPKAKPRRLIPYFFLVDKAKIPERPYLRPAMEMAVEEFPLRFSQMLGDSL